MDGYHVYGVLLYLDGKNVRRTWAIIEASNLSLHSWALNNHLQCIMTMPKTGGRETGFRRLWRKSRVQACQGIT